MVAHSFRLKDPDRKRFAGGLPEAEVLRLRDILRREHGVELSMEETWARALDLLSFFKALLK